MAFSGVHIECGFGGSRAPGKVSPIPNFPVEGELTWSQTMAAPGTTTLAAPASNSIQGDPLLCIDTTIDIYVAIGPNPDATQSPRMLVRANVPRQRYVREGDKVNWDYGMTGLAPKLGFPRRPGGPTGRCRDGHVGIR